MLLDHWICKTALAWGWEEERFLKDADFEAAVAELRHALFPELGPLGGGGGGGGAEGAASAEETEEAAEAAARVEELVASMDW